MKAIKINNKIEKFSRLPKAWEDANGLHLNIGDGSSLGFKEVVQPTYDSRIEELDNLHLKGDVYTYEVVDKKIEQTLAELKSQLTQKLKDDLGYILSLTDWYIIRESDSGELIPQSIKENRKSLRAKSNSIEAEINALTTKKSVVLFDINL